MLAEFAAYESDRMGDVWREVRERRARLGLPVNGHNQFGYRKQGDAFVVDRRTGPVIADLYRRYVAGESLRSLARWLNRGRYMAANPRMPRTVWSHGTVAALLDRGFAAGYIVAEGQYLPGAQKALITEAEWLAYRSRREQTSWQHHTDRDAFLLEGLLTCRCGTAMTPEEALGGDRKKYRCRSHGTPSRSSTVNQNRIDTLIPSWLRKLAEDPRTSAIAKQDAERWARERWRAARVLAASLPALEVHLKSAVLDEIALTEGQAAVIDPALLAQALLEDWQHLNNPSRRARLRALVVRFVVDNTYSTPVLDVFTTWGETMRFWGYVEPAAPTPTVKDSPHTVTGDTSAEPRYDDWLTVQEAARLLGVCPSTLNQWRRAGILPDATSISGRHVYQLRELRQLAHAPKKTGGIDRGAALALVVLDVSSSPGTAEHIASAGQVWQPRHPNE
jgi:hypothetical protein